MKKSLLFLTTIIYLLSFSAQTKGQSVDTINVLAQNKVHMGGNGSYYAWGVFPPDTNSYRKVLLNFTLGCPSGGCSQWDYTVDIYLNHNTGIVDSTMKQAPTFTVNGNTMDSVHVNKDTTYTTYYDTATHTTDSTRNNPYTIVQYKDTLTPNIPTDTVKWWQAGYYKYYYNNVGAKTDSIYVTDSTMYVRYHSYKYKYDSIQSYEIARMITPYAGYYPNTWTYPYVFDVSDFDWMMHDSVQIQVFYSGWTDGFTATCNFQMITGIPPHKAYKTVPLWTGSFPYGSASNPISNYLVPKPIKIDSAASAVSLRILQTGHGEDDNNCTEFCANYQHIKVNGVEHFTPYVWRDLCGLNPLYHQAGTWLYDRANWCPGELITPYEDDLTPYVTPNHTDTILMAMDPYTSPNGGSIYTIGAELIYYGPINFSLDAQLDDILSPTTNPLYSRFNPSCAMPQVVIRNTGSTPLTSLDIIYGALGGVTNTYHWTGNLLFNDTNLVTLPTTSLGGSQHLFRAKVSKPNGGQDMYPNNDSLVTPFVQVPNYNSSFVIKFSTNSAASEDSYFIADDMGNIVHQKSGFANNTTYRDTVSLPSGCYHFEMDDAGKDGISFFANNDGNGSLQFVHLSPASLFLTLQSDFGTSIIQNFTVGGPLDIDEPASPGIDYKVYPNPASYEVTIAELTNSNKDKQVKIYSEIGALVYDKLVKAGTDTYSINVSNLAQGLYCVVISNDDGVVVKKITVTH